MSKGAVHVVSKDKSFWTIRVKLLYRILGLSVGPRRRTVFLSIMSVRNVSSTVNVVAVAVAQNIGTFTSVRAK